MERITSQKQIILDYIQSVHSHPTAEEVFNAVKEKLPRISMGTVYRNLEKFAENGIITEIKGDLKRFDGDISNHYHFICNNCKKVFDIPEAKLNVETLLPILNKLGKATNCSLYIYGICKKCQVNKSKKSLKGVLATSLKDSKNMACKKKKKTRVVKTKTATRRKKCGTKK